MREVKYAELKAGDRIRATFDNPGHWKEGQKFEVFNAMDNIFFIYCDQGTEHFLDPQTDDDGFVIGFVKI